MKNKKLFVTAAMSHMYLSKKNCIRYECLRMLLYGHTSGSLRSGEKQNKTKNLNLKMKKICMKLVYVLDY